MNNMKNFILKYIGVALALIAVVIASYCFYSVNLPVGGRVPVNPLGSTISPTELAVADFGSFSCDGTTCSLDVSYLPLTGGTLSGTLDTATLSIASAFTFPTTDGTANYVLRTDGSGTVTWTYDKGTSYKGGVGLLNFDADTDIDAVDYAVRNITLTGIYCQVDTGTVSFDLKIDDGSPGYVNGSMIECDSDGTLDTSLAGDVDFDATNTIDLILDAVTDSTKATFFWYGTYDNE